MRKSGIREISVQELQAIQLEMLHTIADICDSHNIRYYLASGTLLGAVRHQGPIPWDDDMDIQIPRPDYLKLLELLQAGILPDSLAYSWLDSSSHPYPFLKIFHTGSAVVESKLEPLYRDSMIWIDVFPIDGLPQGRAAIRRAYAISKFLRNFLYTGITKPSSLKGVQKVGTIMLKPLSRAIGAHRIARWLNAFSRRYDMENAQIIGNLAWGEHSGEALDAAAYLPVVDLPYGDRRFHCPQGYDEHLKNLYGDYMSLPPVEKRRSHLSSYHLIPEADSGRNT